MNLSCLKDRKFWLLALATGLTVIFFALVDRAGDTGHLGVSVLIYFCVATLLWENRTHLQFEGHWPSSAVGVLLIGWMLKNSSPDTNEYLVRLFPIVSGLGLALIASGWRRLKQYWQVLLLLFVLSVPSVLAYYWIDLSPVTARASALLLWYTGFDVRSQGVVLGIQGGQPIEVVYDCSGIDMVLYMMSLSIACLVMFPVSGFKRIVFPLMAITLGFFLNSLRVAMLAVMFSSDRAAFNQWHTGTGSYTFALIGVIILGFIYCFFLSYRHSIPACAEENSLKKASWASEFDSTKNSAQ